MKELIGHTIKALQISAGKELLKFIADDGEQLCFQTEGDCCNEVWFNHLNGIERLLGATVTDAIAKEWVDMTNEEAIVDGHKWPDVEEKMLWTIVTTKGYFDVEVRNSHNGYYGGCVVYAPGGGWTSHDTLSDVTADF